MGEGGKKPSMGRKAKSPSDTRACLLCDRPIKAKGLCLRHYCASYSKGTCSFPGCSTRARAMHLCQNHYMRRYRVILASGASLDLQKSPSSPYVTDCSEASSCGDWTDSATASRHTTPRSDVFFALQADMAAGVQGDIAYGQYWRLVNEDKAARMSFGEESSPTGRPTETTSV